MVRILLPLSKCCKFESRLNLIIHDVFYITDSLDFSTVLFDSSKKLFNETYKNLVLCILAFSTTFYSIEALSCTITKTLEKITIISRFKQFFMHDSLVNLLLPCLFYDIPIIIARTIIFYGSRTINLENFAFLFKNIISILIKIAEYFELRINE